MTKVEITVPSARGNTLLDGSALIRKSIREIPMNLVQNLSVLPGGDQTKIVLSCRSQAHANDAYSAFKTRFKYSSGKILGACTISNSFGRTKVVDLLSKNPL